MSRHGRGEGGHSEGICRRTGIESKCERHWTQRTGGQENRKFRNKKKNKKDPLLEFTFFFGKKLALRLEL
jgi:hypothetical protein